MEELAQMSVCYELESAEIGDATSRSDVGRNSYSKRRHCQCQC